MAGVIHTANFPDPYIHPKSIMELIDSSYELVRVYAIMMDVNVTDLATLAEAHELLQPVESFGTSCDRRGDKFITQLSKRIYMLLPETTTILGGQIGLGRYFGLIPAFDY